MPIIIIVKTVQTVIEETIGETLHAMGQQMKMIEDTADRDRALNRMTQDKQDQYSRRENIRILGIREVEGESEDSLIAAVEEMAGVLDVQLIAPISTAHRAGRRGQKDRPVLVRFTARRDKNN